MRRHLLKIILLLFSCNSFAVSDLIPVKIAVSEGLSLADSTSSERYRQAFEAALYFAIGENETRVNACGYKFQVFQEYFDASDSMAPQQAGKNLSTKGIWSVFGPRRSEQFKILTSGLQRTVAVSPMAESLAIHAEKPPLFTMYLSSKELATAALKASIKENYGKTFGAVVDATCSSCREFESEFTTSAKVNGLTRLFLIDVAGDGPDLTTLMDSLAKNPVNFLLIPNYSKQSGHIISKVSQRFPEIKFVGGNGWGDGQYGFLLKYPIGPKVEGLCVRQGTNFENMNEHYNVRSLDYDWQGSVTRPNFTAFAAIRWLRQLADDLCKERPKSLDDFYVKASAFPSDHFRMRDQIGVFKLHDAKLGFAYEMNQP